MRQHLHTPSRSKQLGYVERIVGYQPMASFRLCSNTGTGWTLFKKGDQVQVTPRGESCWLRAKVKMVNKDAPDFKFYSPRFKLNKRILAELSPQERTLSMADPASSSSKSLALLQRTELLGLHGGRRSCAVTGINESLHSSLSRKRKEGKRD